MCPSPTPSYTCPGRKAVTPSPHPAVRGPWHSSMPCRPQKNVSVWCPGTEWYVETSLLPLWLVVDIISLTGLCVLKTLSPCVLLGSIAETGVWARTWSCSPCYIAGPWLWACLRPHSPNLLWNYYWGSYVHSMCHGKQGLLLTLTLLCVDTLKYLELITELKNYFLCDSRRRVQSYFNFCDKKRAS